MTIELRPYQQDAVERLRTALRQHRHVCLVMPTGSGKTIVFGRVATGVVRKGKRCLILVHRRELIAQTLAKLAFFGIKAGVIAAGWAADPEQPVQVASVQTLARRLDDSSRLSDFSGTSLEEREAELHAQYGPRLGAKRQDAVRMIRTEIEAMRGAAIGARHPVYLHAAARIKALCDFWAIPIEHPRELLEEAYVSTLTPEEARQRERGSIDGVWNWLERKH